MCQSYLNYSIMSYKYDNILYCAFIILYTFIVKLCNDFTCGIDIDCIDFDIPQEWIIILIYNVDAYFEKSIIHSPVYSGASIAVFVSGIVPNIW